MRQPHASPRVPARAPARAWAACVACLLAAPAALAASASSGAGALPRTASVNLDFAIHIDRFIFFRIGDGAWPTPGGTISQVSFALTPSIPAVPTAPVNGSNRAVNWSGAAPGFSVAASGNVLPVEVRSNGGQVNLRATVGTPLTSGSNSIPMSQIVVSSSDAQLPAPPIPNSGSGAAVNVAGGGSGAVNSLVTLRSAQWTFSFANTVPVVAGQYSGQLVFTASTP
ncbi:hypothetical protein PGB34_14930 [Xenophilus arseniciresistens]|uniref:WxL domain-containing protein n=1 Tax=Xenophilus arseniciresistens TaxID=1283306 RepID=A0AAE3N8L4_9BURK|nr:hypothetical protein [Xenophilus arseniciresistens]MDA7417655.1 hypothetical protein [Xenophilus arseniciresistens]